MAGGVGSAVQAVVRRGEVRVVGSLLDPCRDAGGTFAVIQLTLG